VAKHIAVSNRASGVVVEDYAFLQQGINRLWLFVVNVIKQLRSY